MQAAITQGYRSLGAALGVAVAPAGEAWQTVLRANSDDRPLAGRRSHPSPARDYLAACVLYARIFDASPVGIAERGVCRPTSPSPPGRCRAAMITVGLG